MSEQTASNIETQRRSAFFENWDVVLSEDAQICNFGIPMLEAESISITATLERLASFGDVPCVMITDSFLQSATQYYKVQTARGPLVMVKQRTQVSAGDMVLLSKMSPEKFDQMFAEAERLSDFQK